MKETSLRIISDSCFQSKYYDMGHGCIKVNHPPNIDNLKSYDKLLAKFP
jgi:hypothetical protein